MPGLEFTCEKQQPAIEPRRLPINPGTGTRRVPSRRTAGDGDRYRQHTLLSIFLAAADRQGYEAGVVTRFHPYQHAALALRPCAGDDFAYFGGR